MARSRVAATLPTISEMSTRRGLLRSLWRALAVVWLGGIASPRLTDDAMSLDRLAEERPAAIKAQASETDAVSARSLPSR